MDKKRHIASFVACLMALLLFALPIGQGLLAYSHAQKVYAAQSQQQADDERQQSHGKMQVLSQAVAHTSFASISWDMAEWPSFQFGLAAQQEASLGLASAQYAVALLPYFRTLLRHCISPQAP